MINTILSILIGVSIGSAIRHLMLGNEKLAIAYLIAFAILSHFRSIILQVKSLGK